MREDPAAPPPPAMTPPPPIEVGVTEVGLVGAHQPRAMSKMEEVGARSSGGLRRSPRLIRKKELSACASEQDLILMLKKESRALEALYRERVARDGRLDFYMAGRQAAERYLSRMVAAEVDDRKAVAGGGKDRKAAEPAGDGNKRRKKVVKSTVPQELIDWYILNQHSNPFICEELELGKHSQMFREHYAERKATWNKHREYEQAIIKQFRTKGYAEDYTEVTDSEDDN